LERAGEVRTNGGSVIAYERWRETGEQSILDGIEHVRPRPCIPRRMSVWPVAIQTRTSAEMGIIAAPSESR
jgi:hypothetical protein